MNQLELEEKILRYLKNEDALSISAERICDFLFHTKLKDLIPNQIEIPNVSLFLPLFQNLKKLEEAFATNPTAIYPYHTLGEGIDQKTGDTLADFLTSLEVEPSAKLIEDLLKQKAFQDIIANIIESGIIEFNKKTNPLFGMIQATGLDKQIKSFIQLFLPNFMPKIANFLHSTSFGENSTLTKDMVLVALHTDFGELKLPSGEKLEEAKQKWEVLKNQIAVDSKLNSTISGAMNSVLTLTKAIIKEESLFSLLQIPESDYIKFKKSISIHFAKQTVQYAPKDEIKKLLLGIFEDIGI